MAMYIAPKPQTVQAVPPTPIRQQSVIQKICFSIVNKILGIAIYPAQLRKDNPKEREKMLQIPRASPIQFASSDGTRLDGTLLRGNLRKAILYVGGNGDLYEKRYPRMARMREHVGDVNLFFFNPRGIGRSEGSPNGKRLALDVHAAFRYLVDVEGFNPSDIVIFGHSLGGGHGALGAALAQEDFPEHPINYISYNSFRKITSVMHDVVSRTFPRFKRLQRVFHRQLEKWVNRLDWQMDELSAVQRIRGRKYVIVNKSDSVIRTHASLYRGLKELNTPLDIPVLKMDGKDKRAEPWYNRREPLAGRWQHMRPFNHWESYEIANRIKEIFEIPHSPSLDPGRNILQRANPYSERLRNHMHVLEAINRQIQFLDFSANTPATERTLKLHIVQDAQCLLAKKLNKSKGTPADWLRAHLKGNRDSVLHYRQALESTRLDVLNDLRLK